MDIVVYTLLKKYIDDAVANSASHSGGSASESGGQSQIVISTKYHVVDSLPDPNNAEEATVYLVLDESGTEAVYKQYMFVDGAYRLLGNATVTGGGSSSGGSSGGNGEVDAALSFISENPVQNKVIAAALAAKVDDEATSSMMFSSSQTANGTHLGSITIDDESWNIDDCPTNENGTFVRKCVVNNGVATYSWVKE